MTGHDIQEALSSSAWGTFWFLAGYLAAQTYAVRKWGRW